MHTSQCATPSQEWISERDQQDPGKRSSPSCHIATAHARAHGALQITPQHSQPQRLLRSPLWKGGCWCYKAPLVVLRLDVLALHCPREPGHWLLTLANYTDCCYWLEC